MDHKGIKLNGLLLLFIVLAMIGINFYLSSISLGSETSEILENIAIATNITKIVWWVSAVIPLLFFSIYFTVRRVLYKGGSLTAYATNAGIVASMFMFLDLIRLPTINTFLAGKYMAASLFEKQMIVLVFESMNEYFFYIGKVFAPIFFNVWLLLVGIIIVKSSSLKRALGFVAIFVALLGFANLLIVSSMLTLIYSICLWFTLFLVALALLLF